MEGIIKHISNEGTIKTADVVADGISKFDYYRYLKQNNFEKIAPGLYAKSGTWPDDLAIIKKRCPQAVISHDEALYYYGLVDREPAQPTFTIYSGYNVSRLKENGYKTFYVKKELLDLGKITVKDFNGTEVNMYDLERTVCDLVRNRSSFEIQDFTSALKAYVKRKDKNLTKLFEYADAFKVKNILRKYLEVLL